jgi:hypothetical protein
MEMEQKVRAENSEWEEVLRVLRNPLLKDVPVLITHAATSHLPRVGTAGGLAKLEGFSLESTDLCGFGNPWKGSTSVWVRNCDASTLVRTCPGTCQHLIPRQRGGEELHDGRGGAPEAEEFVQRVVGVLGGPMLRDLPDSTSINSFPGVESEFELPDLFGSDVVDSLPWASTRKEASPALGDYWTRADRWKVVVMGGWKRKEHINVLEGRAALQFLRRASRSQQRWHKRSLLGTDSSVVRGAFGKGRSSSWPLLLLSRRLCSLALGLRMRMNLRQVWTDVNPADGPSRGQKWAGILLKKLKS